MLEKLSVVSPLSISFLQFVQRYPTRNGTIFFVSFSLNYAKDKPMHFNLYPIHTFNATTAQGRWYAYMLILFGLLIARPRFIVREYKQRNRKWIYNFLCWAIMEIRTKVGLCIFFFANYWTSTTSVSTATFFYLLFR